MSKLPRRSVSVHHEEPLELENHFVLRLPADTATKVNEWLEEGGSAFKDRLFIQFQPDMRHALVRVDHETLYGKLMDLPCVVETLKTLDKKTFYKVADIGQMLICTTEPEVLDDEQKAKLAAEAKDPKKKDKQYQFGHGITPPLKNVRKRRFRKTLKKKYMDAPELEKELKRLLREDMEAVNVRWEIVTPEQEAQQKLKSQKQKHPDGEDPSTSAAQSSKQGGGEAPLSREHELFGDALTSSSEDDDSRPPSAEVQIPDSDNELDVSMAGPPSRQRHGDSESITNQMGGDDEDDAEGFASAQRMMAVDVEEERPPEVDSETLRMQIVQLQSQLMRNEKSRRNNEIEANATENTDLRNRLLQEIQTSVDRDKEIREEVASLKRKIQRIG